MRRKIEEELSVLIGQPFSDMFRYAGCQKFEFGEQHPFTNRKGQETTLGDWGLVVACDWRITQRGEEVVCYDDFGPGYERRDENGPAFYELLKTKPPLVEAINADEAGGLIFRLADDFVLEVIPRREAETERWAIHEEFRESLLADGELWRFMPKKEEELAHFVVTTSGIEDPERAYGLFGGVRSNHCIGVQTLIDQGISLTQKNPYEDEEETVLGYAAVYSETKMVRLLLKNGAGGVGEDLPMLAAARGGNLETVRLFVERGGDVNQPDETGWTPLMEAAAWGETEIVRFLVANGADVSRRTQTGESALQIAEQNNEVKVATYLRAHGAGL